MMNDSKANSRKCYRKNHTGECFYKVLPEKKQIEAVFLFDDTYRKVEIIQCDPIFIRQIIEEMQPIQAKTFHRAKAFVKQLMVEEQRSGHYRPHQACEDG